MLTLNEVAAFYGKSQVLDGVSLEVGTGETVALLGRNGAGKSTLLKSVMGLVRRSGRITFDGHDLDRRSAFESARMGIAYVPEDRGIFGRLTVEQNLAISRRPGAQWSLEDVYDRFPRLAERRRNKGDRLSGGEQQMLAIARALLGAPRLVMLDEPTEGLAPVIVAQLADVLADLRQRGPSVLLVEQRLDLCLQLADRVYVLDSGRMVFDGTVQEFQDAPSIRDRHLALKTAGPTDSPHPD
ncbi:ABC transporter ATP-binding protein [Actinomadura sp. KC216]|uniref:ABC transporter ATP-binding protein n=1 Tax=Actinomadura sp. KC216 TaxID=2530370 RepID=UPI00104CFD06|nr:ABC transporter ATP-binding protein [Actinomadura sp. KC216]TDB77362.1 ABC transporter ATP-binding protein [Actinomadura sp. KC216]